MKCLEASQGGEKQYNDGSNSEDKKGISVAWVIKIYVWKACRFMNQTLEDLFSFKEHPDRNQKKSENKKPGEYYINKKPQIGTPFVKNGGYHKEKKYQ
jgi:hypothetical protein